MGPLHVQLNLIGSILKNFWSFFNLEYEYLFSTSKNLSQNPSPYLLMDLARNAWEDVKPMVISKFGKYCRDLEYLFLVDLLDNTIPLV